MQWLYLLAISLIIVATVRLVAYLIQDLGPWISKAGRSVDPMISGPPPMTPLMVPICNFVAGVLITSFGVWNPDGLSRLLGVTIIVWAIYSLERQYRLRRRTADSDAR